MLRVWTDVESSRNQQEPGVQSAAKPWANRGSDAAGGRQTGSDSGRRLKPNSQKVDGGAQKQRSPPL